MSNRLAPIAASAQMTRSNPDPPVDNRKRYVLILAAVAFLGAALVLWRFIPRDHSSHITRSQALRLFDQHLHRRPQMATNGGIWPELGVYRYETQGAETIDTGLLDGSHDYKGLSTVTLWPGDCGLVERWQVLATRWNQSETCRGGGGREELHSLEEFHEFFGVSQEDSFECNGWSALAVAKSESDRPVTSMCRSAVTSVVNRMHILGVGRINVGGVMVAAVRMNGTASARGQSAGMEKFSEWRRRSDGLLLRRTVNGVIDSEANGGFAYHESYAIRLLSLTPER